MMITSRGCSYNPGTPALIKRRSSLHEPGGSEYQPHWNPTWALEACGAPLVPLWTFSSCWLLRRGGSYNVLDGARQRRVRGGGGVDLAGPTGKLDQQARRAGRAPEGRRRPLEGGEAVGDLAA